ncbi:MAG: hypothetical protein IJ468_13620 [Lachnospiraceae bacterium]|nr:hypothetical protein [Lachnospiraceae bacterium]
MMKKRIAVGAAMLLATGTIGMQVMAAEAADVSVEPIEVYVTIADSEGALALAQEPVAVTDMDDDGVLTINDALYCAHEACYEGGAEAGYGSAFGDYGLSMTKLWGAENGGSYGYRVNDQSAWSLEDPVADGDYVNAYVYTDLTAWSDTYCYFDAPIGLAEKEEEITLVLNAAGYDEAYNPIAVPVAGAVITVDGEATEFVTDEEGKVTLTLDEEGIHVISAQSETQNLVPPVCTAAVGFKAVTVTISDDTGALVLIQEPVLVNDADEDGAITIHDALFCAHEQNYEGGAEAGYASEEGEYGLSMTLLWGVDNGGSYGYYVNDVSAWSLLDPVATGDCINAYAFTDLTAWSDTYCYFNSREMDVTVGDAAELVLLAAAFDSDYNPITVPVEGAVLVVDGEATDIVTDAEGKAVFTVEKEGLYIVSAVSDSQTLVPPVCLIHAQETEVTAEGVADGSAEETADGE